jgi:hypothetical protein
MHPPWIAKLPLDFRAALRGALFCLIMPQEFFVESGVSPLARKFLPARAIFAA